MQVILDFFNYQTCFLFYDFLLLLQNKFEGSINIITVSDKTEGEQIKIRKLIKRVITNV